MIVNLTQHPASSEQIAAGVVDLAGGAAAMLRTLLTFESAPTQREIYTRADQIAGLCKAGDELAMIGGALWLMEPLAHALRLKGIEPVFAFSVRETEEQAQADGSVRKVAMFRHTGFVPAC